MITVTKESKGTLFPLSLPDSFLVLNDVIIYKKIFKENKNMKSSLGLILTHKWYDMIASGVKKEEYREIKPFYVNRLTDGMIHGTEDNHHINVKHYDYIRFHRGYTKTSMLVELKGVRIGKGNPDWGAPDYPVFILSLGEILEKT